MFEVVERLKAQGVAIVYVSHRMKEIFEIADKVTVLRDGRKIATRNISEVTEQSLIRMMVGKEVSQLYPVRPFQQRKETVLQVKQLSLDAAHAVSFQLHKGEILGLFGLPGSGSHTIACRLFGLAKGTGEIGINGKPVQINSPAEAKEMRIAYVPPDRHRQGIIKPLSIRSNLALPILRDLSEGGRLNQEKIKKISQYYMDRLHIKSPNDLQSVDFLSGGNQQKVVIGKWLASKPEILILEEPTRGVDVGAKPKFITLFTNWLRMD